MKPIDLVTRINQTVARETSGSAVAYGEQELSYEELLGIKWAVARDFHAAIREAQQQMDKAAK